MVVEPRTGPSVTVCVNVDGFVNFAPTTPSTGAQRVESVSHSTSADARNPRAGPRTPEHHADGRRALSHCDRRSASLGFGGEATVSESFARANGSFCSGGSFVEPWKTGGVQAPRSLRSNLRNPREFGLKLHGSPREQWSFASRPSRGPPAASPKLFSAEAFAGVVTLSSRRDLLP
jgi:hypothetical protein